MSKSKKSQDSQSIIEVRAICDVCKMVDTFQISTKELLPHVGGLYQISTIHHCKENKDMIMNIVLDRNYAVRQATVSPFIGNFESDDELKWSDEKVADVKFLVGQVKDADKAVHAVLSSKPIVVISKNTKFVKRVIHTLELFSPVKFPQSIDWTEKNEKNKRLIGTLPELAKNYKDAVIVDLDENKVTNGKTSLYCQSFLESLVKLEPKGMAYAAQLKIEMLIEFAKMLIELSKQDEIGSKAIELVKMDVSDDAYELIVDIVAGFDPMALEIIKSDWL